MGPDQGALPLSRRTALAALLLPALALGGTVLLGAAKDAGTGYRLENVEVLDPLMRLEDARRYMIRFNEALGVQCRDCHDLLDFASDEKPLKLAARKMMKMEIDINERWFPDAEEPVVTCFTCHHGLRVPPSAGGLTGEDAVGGGGTDDGMPAAAPDTSGAPDGGAPDDGSPGGE